MRHSVRLTQLTLPDKPPAFLLTQTSRAFRRKVKQIMDQHPDWAPEAVRRHLFKEGLAVYSHDLHEVMPQDDTLSNLLPLRLVKARLGMWN